MSLTLIRARELDIIHLHEPESVAFVAKVQKAKTRKGKDYFVLRTTVPKSVAEKIDAKAGDYLFFKARKAEWYHMLNWEKMEETWRMLPDDIRNRVVSDGMFNQSIRERIGEEIPLGATNPTGSIPLIGTGYPHQNGDINGSSI